MVSLNEMKIRNFLLLKDKHIVLKMYSGHCIVEYIFNMDLQELQIH